MKLFQRLLVAPAALGLFSPLAANATEVYLNDISNYSDVESIDFTNSFDNDKSTKSPLPVSYTHLTLPTSPKV